MSQPARPPAALIEVVLFGAPSLILSRLAWRRSLTADHPFFSSAWQCRTLVSPLRRLLSHHSEPSTDDSLSLPQTARRARLTYSPSSLACRCRSSSLPSASSPSASPSVSLPWMSTSRARPGSSRRRSPTAVSRSSGRRPSSLAKTRTTQSAPALTFSQLPPPTPPPLLVEAASSPGASLAGPLALGKSAGGPKSVDGSRTTAVVSISHTASTASARRPTAQTTTLRLTLPMRRRAIARRLSSPSVGRGRPNWPRRHSASTACSARASTLCRSLCQSRS